MSRLSSTISDSALFSLLSGAKPGLASQTPTSVVAGTPAQAGEREPADTASLGEQNVQRLLVRLSQEGATGVTVAELLASGVRSPAQSVYDLQLAGYDIDRIWKTQAGGHRAASYFLRGTTDPPLPAA